MDAVFWLTRWVRKEIGFHQATPHSALQRYWASLAVPSGAPVLVPLAGKSRDMVWLTEHGYRVIGIELSEIAVREFFAECGLHAEHSAEGVWTSGAYTLICSDIFALDRARVEALAGQAIGGVFDRAALIALPPPMRQRYATQMAGLVREATPTLLVTLEYEQSEMEGPPHSVAESEVHALYGGTHRIELLSRDDNLNDFPKFAARGVRRIAECVYRMT